ncbi:MULTISPECIES: EI24 domain-containing protein [Roseateles]|uniref:EI24 domain-containing protein n=1 Tax=Pelomonas caseinilytica TaxID=2906763 RepID=A0ABS8XBB6_9BURK|nr:MULTISPECIES: EI24 domain-containing protein [unclassified Roseateles]MCE4536178.1 EI24 domain-containing protein [Pelomonas sp. P7]HEV6966404.1 EI24 domain-containing protein [Roseateles sp.]
MQGLIDAFWRAVAYCLHPRVIGLSLLPLVICGVLVFGFMYFFWEASIAGVRATLESWRLVESLLQWLDAMGWQSLRSALAAILVLAGVLPVVVLLSLLLVALCMTPAIVRLVAERRFPLLEKKRGGTLLQSVAASLGATLVALVLIVLSMPLWLVPPLVMVLPPLIWGWLTYRVFGFDVLAEHASAEERHALLREHRLPMLAMGVVCGYLGAAPSLIWAISGITGIIFAPFVVLLAIWLYTLVFAFSTAWFAHYGLAALQARRAAEPVAESAVLIES